MPRDGGVTGTGGAAVGGGGATGWGGAGAGSGGANAGTGGGGGRASDDAATTADASTGGSAGDAGPVTAVDPAAPRPLNVNLAASCKCELKFSAIQADPAAGKSGSDTHAGDQQAMKVDVTRPLQGKLAIVFGGIGGGPGPGGIYGYAISKGFHAFLVATQTAISSAPDMYKNLNTPEANRQVGDARMEAWDGVDRVTWLDVKPPDSGVNRTQAALKRASTLDPGGDWGYFLNADGTVRWTDVVLIGYSFGSQTIAMVSKYVRVSRVCATSGPASEGFPDAEWITHPSATPVDRLYMMVGGDAPYPPASGNVGDKIDTTSHAGWLGPPINVKPADTGPFGDAHQIVLVGSGPGAPGGHSEFCAGDGGGWRAICNHFLGAK